MKKPWKRASERNHTHKRPSLYNLICTKYPELTKSIETKRAVVVTREWERERMLTDMGFPSEARK